MRNKIRRSTKLTGYLILILIATVHAFTQTQTREFGWSLKRFENDQKQEKKDKKDRKEKNTVKSNQAIPPTSTSAVNQISNTVTGDDDETIRVETNLVINDVLVVDEKGTAVPNLKAQDFIISEDGTEQKVELFAYGENAKLPRSIVLIMSGHFLPYRDAENGFSGAEWLIDKLAPQDKMAIVTFDLKLWLPFTKDKNLLKKTLAQIPPTLNGLTIPKDYGTLMTVLNEMFDEKDVRPIVIFQSAGNELSGLKLDGDTPLTTEFNRKLFPRFYGDERGYGLRDVKESIAKSKATIYSIIPTMRFVGVPREEQMRRAKINIEEWMWYSQGEKNSRRVDDAIKKHQSEGVAIAVSSQTVMIEVAKLSGGYTEWIERPEDVKKVYSTIFGVINNRYTIGYYPINQTKSGKLRSVKITVRGHPEYMILGRESYFEPGVENKGQ